MINARRASLIELQRDYSLEDLYLLLETVLVEAENDRRAQEAAERA